MGPFNPIETIKILNFQLTASMLTEFVWMNLSRMILPVNLMNSKVEWPTPTPSRPAQLSKICKSKDLPTPASSVIAPTFKVDKTSLEKTAHCKWPSPNYLPIMNAHYFVLVSALTTLTDRMDGAFWRMFKILPIHLKTALKTPTFLAGGVGFIRWMLAMTPLLPR